MIKIPAMTARRRWRSVHRWFYFKGCGVS